MPSEFHIDYGPICHLYAREQVTGTLYLAFRDIPQLLKTFLPQNKIKNIKAFDFGCGTGVSTRYLKSLENLFKMGLEVEGADINKDMLKLAQEADPKGVYHQIHQDKIPVPDETYDLVLSTFVLFEFASKEKMQKALEEIKRVMKRDAIFIAVTGSAEAYNRENQWVSLNVDFPQNDFLKSGDLGRVDFLINEETMTFQNYYWTEQDYHEIFQKSGLSLEMTHRPKGYKEEEKTLSWNWKSEISVAPYYTFVLSHYL
jgi:ubiquinone/menaquinone biosynthesis C-methylase UbiE